MGKKKAGGSLIYNVFNVGFTVVMFALPSVLLGYWYFYIRPQAAKQPAEIIVRQQAEPKRDPVLSESPSRAQQSPTMFDPSESVGIFSESPKDQPSNFATEKPSVQARTRKAPTREEREMRKWRDASGAFSVVAKFYSASGDNVKLIAEDDREIEVPIAKLSEDDKVYLRELFKSKGIRARF